MKRRRKCYMTRAKRRFLEGTRFRAPIDAVLAGVRTLEDWVTVLEEERHWEAEHQRRKRLTRDSSLWTALDEGRRESQVQLSS